MTKAAVLTAGPVDFELLETMLWEAQAGYYLLQEHLQRLADSADYFGFDLDPNGIRQRLLDAAAHFGTEARRVRLRVDPSGQAVIEEAPLDKRPLPRRLVLASRPIDRHQPWLYHKTTRREVYSAAAAGMGDCDDVILYNEQRQVTETTAANIVVDLDGRLLTPPVECGLLAGVFRSHLLRTGQVREAIITLDDIRRAERLFAVNSVRRWMPAVLVKGHGSQCGINADSGTPPRPQ
jgi:para-aminobenzoate synthetase/4-amino-4-deoxychorismate lyase